jgi:ComF family protein
MIKPSEWLSTLSELLVNGYGEFLVNKECRAGRCVGCLNPVAQNGLCQGCYTELPWNRWHCQCCALPLPFPAADHLCGECLQRPPAFDLTLAPLRYQFPVAAMIGRYKYQGQRAYGRPLTAALGELANEHLLHQPQLRPNVLIPAPMHPQRRRQRGFNQARDIAEQLGARLDIPLAGNLVQRQRSVQAQRSLNRAQRLANLQGVFKTTGTPPPRIAIIDDVVTTGATTRLLAHALRQAGAEHIQIWALARTPG